MEISGECDDHFFEGLVLVPTPEAMVQNLGPFLSGRMMETDLAPQSALVCAAKDGKPVLNDEGNIRFSFEGNTSHAENLKYYHERCRMAASRLATQAPSIAYGTSSPSHLKPVARINLFRFTFIEILDQDALEQWGGEPVSDFLPPKDMKTPTTDPDILVTLCGLPMHSLVRNSDELLVWSLLDGTILTMEAGKQSLCAWRPGDPGLTKVLEGSGLSMADRMMITKYA